MMNVYEMRQCITVAMANNKWQEQSELSKTIYIEENMQTKYNDIHQFMKIVKVQNSFV